MDIPHVGVFPYWHNDVDRIFLRSRAKVGMPSKGKKRVAALGDIARQLWQANRSVGKTPSPAKKPFRAVVSLRGVLSPTQCRRLAALMSNRRKNWFQEHPSYAFSRALEDRLRPWLPLANRQGDLVFDHLSHRTAFMSSGPSRSMGIHRHPVEKTGRHADTVGINTHQVMIYLDDENDGGGTTVYEEQQHGELRPVGVTAPMVGKATIMEQDVWHDGGDIRTGRRHVLFLSVVMKKKTS